MNETRLWVRALAWEPGLLGSGLSSKMDLLYDPEPVPGLPLILTLLCAMRRSDLLISEAHGNSNIL